MFDTSIHVNMHLGTSRKRLGAQRLVVLWYYFIGVLLLFEHFARLFFYSRFPYTIYIGHPRPRDTGRDDETRPIQSLSTDRYKMYFVSNETRYVFVTSIYNDFGGQPRCIHVSWTELYGASTPKNMSKNGRFLKTPSKIWYIFHKVSSLCTNSF